MCLHSSHLIKAFQYIFPKYFCTLNLFPIYLCTISWLSKNLCNISLFLFLYSIYFKTYKIYTFYLIYMCMAAPCPCPWLFHVPVHGNAMGMGLVKPCTCAWYSHEQARGVFTARVYYWQTCGGEGGPFWSKKFHCVFLALETAILVMNFRGEKP